MAAAHPPHRTAFLVALVVGVVAAVVGVVLLVNAAGHAGTCTQAMVDAGECLTVGDRLDDTSSEAVGALVMIFGAAVGVIGVAGLRLGPGAGTGDR